MYNPFSIEGKTFMITGAASGMGRATAITCAKMGARVVVVDLNKEGLEATLSELEGEGHLMFEADLGNSETWVEMLDKTPELNGFAGCAGIASMTPFQFIDSEKMKQVFEINFFGPVMLVKSLIKKKKLGKEGSIVFVSSVDGPKVTHIGNSVYSATKSAMVGMAKNMAVDLAGKTIRVNCILPGTTDTPLIRTANVTEESLAEVVKSFPLKRFGDPQDMANGIIYLLSDASSFVTGTELVIDGGYTLL